MKRFFLKICRKHIGFNAVSVDALYKQIWAVKNEGGS